MNDFGIVDPKVEEAFIKALIANQDKMATIFSLLPIEAMVEKVPGAIYRGLHSLYEVGLVEFEQVTLCNQLIRLGLYDDSGKLEEVDKYFDNSSRANPVVLSKILLDMYARRIEINLADKIQIRASDRSNDLATRLSLIQSDLQQLQMLAVQDDRSLESKEFSRFYKNLREKRYRDAEADIKKMVFKWPDMNVLSPSLVPGDVIALIGEPGAGKTSLMADQSEFWWKEGFHGVLYHLELATEKMADRRIARYTGIPFRRLQDARKRKGLIIAGLADPKIKIDYLTDNEIAQQDKQLAIMDTWPGSLALRYCPGWSMAQICADMRQRAKAGDLNFATLDYWNKVRLIVSRGETPTNARGRDIELFKTTCDDLGIVGIAGAQFDKDSKKTKGYRTVANARDTGEWDDKSNVGLVLDRPYDIKLGRRTDEATLYITKCNAGREGKIQLLFNGPRYQFLSRTHKADEERIERKDV